MRRTLSATVSRIAGMGSGLAICLATAATVIVPPPIDHAMVGRAVLGAEWLAARAAEVPEPAEGAEGAIDQTNWLLATGVADNRNYEAFAAYLSMIGYADARYAIQDWIEEFTRILAAAEAARQSGELREPDDIEAEMNTLPILPLDEAGEAERDRLLDELNLALIPGAYRRAAAAAEDRLQELRMMLPAEVRQ